MEWMKAKEVAELWGVSPRRVNQLCSQGHIEGVIKKGRFWMIPRDVHKPDMVREHEISYDDSKKGNYLPCPVGITSYKEVASECFYVDKTNFINELLADHNKVYLFTRPRRFGKTLMMDMLRTFFEKTEEDVSTYFREKDIWKNQELCKKHLGKYPVIFLSFKDAHSSCWTDLYENICFIIREEYLRHIELLLSERLNEYDKKYFKRILDNQASTVEYQFSLGKLSSMLARHYGEPVIVLIDEYDTPVQQGYLNGYYDDIIPFMRNLFSAVLKDNSNLAFSVLTGILRIAKESLFSGLNNLAVHTILDLKYSEYFGFTKNEVGKIAKYYGRRTCINEVKEWYDGYLFGKTEVYNPWSVVNYFANDYRAKAFWARTSGNEIVSQLIRQANKDVKEDLILLLQGGNVRALINPSIIYPEIKGDADTIYSFLLMSGYLKVTDVVGEFLNHSICKLEIPNKEVMGIFQKEILDYCGTMGSGSILREFKEGLMNGDSTMFCNAMKRYLLQSASSFDAANESFYHGLVFGMVAVLAEYYYITSNRESGTGRFDLQLEPKIITNMGILIEFKHVREIQKEQQLKKEAMLAIEQIIEKRYDTDLRMRGVNRITCFGVACSGKNVVVEQCEL